MITRLGLVISRVVPLADPMAPKEGQLKSAQLVKLQETTEELELHARYEEVTPNTINERIMIVERVEQAMNDHYEHLVIMMGEERPDAAIM